MCFFLILLNIVCLDRTKTKSRLFYTNRKICFKKTGILHTMRGPLL